MEAKTKKMILIVGISILAIGVGVSLFLFFKRLAETREKERQEKEDYSKVNNNNSKPSNNSNSFNTSNQMSSNSTATQNTEIQVVDPNKVAPKFNGENELSNKYSELKDRYLYPKRKEQKGFGYANVRMSPSVNTQKAWYDPVSNFLTSIKSGTSIGKVIGETSTVFNDYSYRWFKVKLTKPVKGFLNTYTMGFVRADVVTFAPYNK
jgi:flagellar basal body-associated protein FliL